MMAIEKKTNEEVERFFCDGGYPFNFSLLKTETDLRMTGDVSPSKSVRNIMKRYFFVRKVFKAADMENMDRNTPHLAVNYFDRYTKRVAVPLKKYAAVFGACFLIATKYNEVEYPDIESLSSTLGVRLLTRDVVQTEQDVLIALDWCLTVPTAFLYAQLLMKSCSDLKGSDRHKAADEKVRKKLIMDDGFVFPDMFWKVEQEFLDAS